MSVYKRFKGEKINVGDKNYNRAKWYVRGKFKGQPYNESVPLAKTKKDAEDREHEIKSLILNGEYELSKKTTTYEEYVNTIYTPRVLNDNPSFNRNKKIQLQRLIKFFGKFQIKHITRVSCERYRDQRKNETVPCQKCDNYKESCYLCSGEKPRYKTSPCWKCRKRIEKFKIHKIVCNPEKIQPSTVNRDLTTHSDILTDAVIDGLMKENPMQFVKRLTEPDPRDRILTAAEKNKLIKFFSGDLSPVENRMRLMVFIAVTTGWRESRIMKICKEDLDYRTQSVLVRRSKNSETQKKEVSDVAWSYLTELAAQIESGPLLRNTRTGEPIRNFPREIWDRMLLKIGIKNLTFHDLRHQAASELLALGVHLFEIQGFLDHKRVTTTQRYLSVQSGHRQNNLNRLGESWKIK